MISIYIYLYNLKTGKVVNSRLLQTENDQIQTFGGSDFKDSHSEMPSQNSPIGEIKTIKKQKSRQYLRISAWSACQD